MSEIPNVAAGVWKATREPLGEAYQLGLPIFLRGNSWIPPIPAGVNTIAQTMRSACGLVFQVVLIWQFGANSGRKSAHADRLPRSPPIHGSYVPSTVLQEAVRAVVETCRIQMNLALEVAANPSDPRDAEVDFGSSIALTSDSGGWQLAVMGNQPACNALTRDLFAMEPDEEPVMADMADALGEIVNVAAGVLKSSRAAAGQKVQLGLPLFMEGKGCIEFFASGIQGMAQTVHGPGDLEVHVILIWQEG